MIGESLSLGAGLKICRRLPPHSQVHTTAADGTAEFFLFFRSFNHGGDDIKNNIILCVFIW